MKNIAIKFVVFTLLVMFSNRVVGQNEIDTIQKLKETDLSYVSIALNYISDAVFMGRKDSITAPYLYPSITYHHKSGFYASGSFSYLTKSNESRIDLFLVSAGYDFTVKKFSGDFSITKYFFNEDSYNVISEVEADLTAAISYDFNVINLGLTSSLYVNNGSGSDFFLSSEISHDFISSNNKFQISPTAGIYLGSQNFYEEYYMTSRFGNDGRGQGQGSGGATETITTVSIEESEKFNLMAIEFSLPMWYAHKQLTVSFLPMFVLPQSEATIIAGDTLVEENLDETFYWMLGLSYTF